MANSGDAFDPFPIGMTTAGGLSSDDPLIDWASNLKKNDLTRFLHDRPGAIDDMVSRGIPPPPDRPASSALGFTDATGQYEIDQNSGMPVFDSRGRMLGNQTSAQGQQPAAVPPPPPPPQAPPQVVPPVAGAQPARPAEAEPAEAEADADVSAQKKKSSAGEALDDFAKSLRSVKAPQAPALNPVGTPGVRSPSAIQAPQLAQLLALAGAAPPVNPLGTLGRLLVQGKA